MKFDKVNKQVKSVPFISEINARNLYQFILDNKPLSVLELGIGYGTASCYIAAALDELGQGKLTCVDLIDVKFSPSAEQQLGSLGLDKYVEIHRMQTGYNWFLHDEIASCSANCDNVCKPKYDLVIIDGPKNWTIDSSSFYLVDKLLNENGWIIWDDYEWTYKKAEARRDVTGGILHRSLSEQEKEVPHIREIFHLLVMQHPSYGNFVIQEGGGGVSTWVWANKIKSPVKSINYLTSYSFKAVMIRKLKQGLKHFKKLKRGGVIKLKIVVLNRYFLIVILSECSAPADFVFDQTDNEKS